MRPLSLLLVVLGIGVPTGSAAQVPTIAHGVTFPAGASPKPRVPDQATFRASATPPSQEPLGPKDLFRACAVYAALRDLGRAIPGSGTLRDDVKTGSDSLPDSVKIWLVPSGSAARAPASSVDSEVASAKHDTAVVRKACYTLPGDSWPSGLSGKVRTFASLYDVAGKNWFPGIARVERGVIHFALGSDALSPWNQNLLARIARALPRDSTRVVIVGRTDSVGGGPRNDSLADRRAAAVGLALIANGVDGNRIRTIGVRDSEPQDNASEFQRRRNRSVEIYYYRTVAPQLDPIPATIRSPAAPVIAPGPPTTEHVRETGPAAPGSLVGALTTYVLHRAAGEVQEYSLSLLRDALCRSVPSVDSDTNTTPDSGVKEKAAHQGARNSLRFPICQALQEMHTTGTTASALQRAVTVALTAQLDSAIETGMSGDSLLWSPHVVGGAAWRSVARYVLCGLRAAQSGAPAEAIVGCSDDSTFAVALRSYRDVLKLSPPLPSADSALHTALRLAWLDTAPFVGDTAKLYPALETAARIAQSLDTVRASLGAAAGDDRAALRARLLELSVGLIEQRIEAIGLTMDEPLHRATEWLQLVIAGRYREALELGPPVWFLPAAADSLPARSDLILAIASATDGGQVISALETYLNQRWSLREKRSYGRPALTLNAYVGVGGSKVMEDPRQWYGSAFAPLGIELGGIGPKRFHPRVLLQVLNLGVPIAARLSGDANAARATFNLGQVIAPGVYLIWPFGMSPFAFLGGAEWPNAFRETAGALRGFEPRLSFGFGVDLTLAPVRRW